jgi:predicted alpha/beta-hydrolase family hydrolase
MNHTPVPRVARRLLFMLSATLIGSLSFLLVVPARAQSAILKTERVWTTRWASVEVSVHYPKAVYEGRSGPAAAIVLAPGQNCLSRGPIFETLTKLATEPGDGNPDGLVVVRFEWDYCKQPAEQRVPSPLQIDETQDLRAVLEYARKNHLIDPTRIALAGKSLGSLVTANLFASSNFKALAILTPVCTYSTNALDVESVPFNVLAMNYPLLKYDDRPILMMTGNQDELCQLSHLEEFLNDSKGNIETWVVGGDHGLTVRNAKGEIDPLATESNISNSARMIVTWVLHQLNKR